MDERQATLAAAIRLGLIFSTIAALAAVALQSLGDVSTARLVVSVIVVGFAISWVRTGRVARSGTATPRVTVAPLRQSIG